MDLDLREDSSRRGTSSKLSKTLGRLINLDDRFVADWAESEFRSDDFGIEDDQV